MPGAARRVEFAADDPLPAEPLIPGAHNRENAAAATAAARAAGIDDDAIAAALRTFPGVAAPARARRRDRRRPLRQRLEGDEHRRRPPRADGVRRAAPPDPRRLAQGRELGRARAGRRAPRTSSTAYLIGEAAEPLSGRSRATRACPFCSRSTLDRAVAEAASAAAAGRRRPALARVRELRPVPRLRAPRRGIQEAGTEPRRVKAPRGQLEQRLLVLVTLALVAFGLVMVFSATSAAAALGKGDPITFLKRQGVYALIGVALLVAASRFDHRRLRNLAPPLLLTALGLCLGGARRRAADQRRADAGSPPARSPSSRRSSRSWRCSSGPPRTSRARERRGRSASSGSPSAWSPVSSPP